jgi:hypothetical protein
VPLHAHGFSNHALILVGLIHFTFLLRFVSEIGLALFIQNVLMAQPACTRPAVKFLLARGGCTRAGPELNFRYDQYGAF